MAGTIPILQARIEELEGQLAAERAGAARLRERLAEFRSLFRIMMTTLEEGARPEPEQPTEAYAPPEEEA